MGLLEFFGLLGFTLNYLSLCSKGYTKESQVHLWKVLQSPVKGSLCAASRKSFGSEELGD